MFESLFVNDHINFESTIALVASTIFWRLLYELSVYKYPNEEPEFNCRIISFIHGIIVAFIGINQCFLIDSPFNHPEWRTNYIQSFLIVFSLGYFIYDLTWMLQYQLQEKLLITHHVYCILALGRMLFKGYSGAQATCALGSMEITNPFLQARWFIRSAGMYPSVLFYSVETTFFIVFITVRIILGSYFLIIILKQEKNDFDFILMALAIYMLSWMFSFNIINCVLVTYGFKKKPNKA